MKKLFHQSGQIALVVLLVMIVMLTLGVTVAQRGLFDVKLSEQEEESSRAFQAAETGVEEALRTLTGTPDKVNLGTDTQYEVGVEMAGQNGFVTAEPLEIGDTLEVDVEGSSGLSQVEVFFIDMGVEDCNTNASAIEVAMVQSDQTIDRSVFDVDSGRVADNGFTQSTKTSVPFEDHTFCAQELVNVPTDTKEIRIRPFYGRATIGVRPAGGTLASQYRVIRSQGETGSGVTRAVEVRRGNPQAASIFDYVLFSGNDLTKPYSGGGVPSPSPSPTPSPSPSPSPTPPPGGPWWDEAWQYRLPILVTSSVSPLRGIRVDMANASSAVGAWVEIDTIELIGPGERKWNFKTNGDFEGWQLGNANNASVANGVVRWQIANSDSYIYRGLSYNERIAASPDQILRVRYKVDYGGAVPGEVYWTTQDDRVWGANNKWFEFSQVANGQWQKIDLQAGQRWGVGPTLTNHQVLVDLNEVGMIQAGHMQVDCDDLRVVDSDNVTPLPFWQELAGNGCYDASKGIWVKVPQIAGTRTIFVYYGNPAATGVSSSIPATFDSVGGGWKSNWKRSGDRANNLDDLPDWPAAITSFGLDTSSWPTGGPSASNVCDGGDGCAEWIRSPEFVITRASEVRFRGSASENETYTVMSPSIGWVDVSSERFTVPKEGRYIWAGRGECKASKKNSCGSFVRIDNIEVGLENFYTRKMVRPEPKASLGTEQMRP